LRNRINGLKTEVIGSQSLPTRVQSTEVDALQKQLATVVGQVNTLITTGLPGLYKQLNDSSIYPNVGEPIKLLRSDTTSPPR
jgi:hypothetical protein